MNPDYQQPRGRQEGLETAFQLWHASITEPKVHLKTRRDDVQTKRRSYDYSFSGARKKIFQWYFPQTWLVVSPRSPLSFSSGWLHWYPEQNATAQNSSWLVPSDVVYVLGLGRDSQDPPGGMNSRLPFLPSIWKVDSAWEGGTQAGRHRGEQQLDLKMVEVNLDASLLGFYRVITAVLPRSTLLYGCFCQSFHLSYHHLMPYLPDKMDILI